MNSLINKGILYIVSNLNTTEMRWKRLFCMITMLSFWWRLKTGATNDIADQHWLNDPRIDDDSNLEDLQNAESNAGISDDDIPTYKEPRQSDRTRKQSRKCVKAKRLKRSADESAGP